MTAAAPPTGRSTPSSPPNSSSSAPPARQSTSSPPSSSISASASSCASAPQASQSIRVSRSESCKPRPAARRPRQVSRSESVAPSRASVVLRLGAPGTCPAPVAAPCTRYVPMPARIDASVGRIAAARGALGHGPSRLQPQPPRRSAAIRPNHRARFDASPSRSIRVTSPTQAPPSRSIRVCASLPGAGPLRPRQERGRRPRRPVCTLGVHDPGGPASATHPAPPGPASARNPVPRPPSPVPHPPAPVPVPSPGLCAKPRSLRPPPLSLPRRRSHRRLADERG